MFQFIQQPCEPMRRRQLFDVANGDERMLINSVLVEEITDNAAADFLEIGKNFSQQTDLVHRKQRVVDTCPVFHHFQNGTARAGIVAEYAIDGDEPPLNGGERGRVQPRLLSMRLRKGGYHLKWIRKIGGEADAVRPAHDRFLPIARLACDFARFQKVVAHQVFGGLTTFGVLVSEYAHDLLLEFE